MRYRNPVIPGFHPDPSVCRVGEDYYLVTSSFEYFPGVPIFHSRDLVHWRQIGHCLTRKAQLNLDNVLPSRGIFAPTIRYHDGRFFMITTHVTGGGNFYVWTEDPAGEWSDPVWVDQGGIDPSLFFDDDGTVYLTSTGPQGIHQSVIDIETGQRLTEIRPIWGGTGGRYPEGPHLYKINGLYYLMIAEGGTEYGHMETIARSTSPWGPFEPCPRNPILSHRDRGTHPIQGTGHAELIEAHDGSWWLVCLAFRPIHGRWHHLGRETFLAPVAWDGDGWPVVGANGGLELEMEAEGLPAHPWPSPYGRDDFDAPQLASCWNFLRNPRDGDWSLTERPGFLRLRGSALTLDAIGSPAFVGRRQEHFRCVIRCHLTFDPAQDGEEAGLTVLANNEHHYDIALTRRDGTRELIVRRRIGDLSAVVARQPYDEKVVVLQIEAEPLRYRLGYVAAEGAFNELATGATRYLSTEVAGGFTGVYFGMYATGNGRGPTAPVDFDWFEYQPAESE